MKADKITYRKFFTVRTFFICSIVLFLFVMVLSQNIFAGCIVDISDVPMETKVQAAPANIMFVIDNSGSMDWEFMTHEDDGKYSGKFYLYPDSAYINYNDRIYSSSYELSASQRTEWKSQWAGYNRIFYNPNAFYSPWPTMTNADTSQPWSNPNNHNAGDSKFNMNGEFYSVGVGGSTEVIVDDKDPGFFLKTPEAWATESNNGYPYYASDYYYTTSKNNAVDDWVTWTPVLPISGKYTVAVWWTSNSNRDTSVYYTVHHQGSDSIQGPFNMQANAGQWNDIGSFNFSADRTEYVKLSPDIAGSSTYSADAVKFYIPSTTISIKNAHYFIINDLNKNGIKDPGEDIYLVNFVNGIRKYYLFNDHNSNGKVDNGELYLKDYADVPAGVKVGKYDENGNFIRFATDAEDLQNFANWFSYYRKRILTVKAAVSGAITKLKGVNIGFYTINPGVRQPVLPVGVKSSDIIIDNKDSGYVESGNWNESSASNEYNGSSRYTANDGYATWTPDLPSSGTYKVYVWYDYWNTRDTNAKYTVHYAGGDYVVRLDQRKNYSQWVDLGQFTFNSGTSGYVRVTRDSSSTGSSTSGDAVKFEATTGGVSVDDTGTLLSLLYSITPGGGTPLRTALNNVGHYFDKDDGNNGNLGPSPFADAADGGGCQQAFTIVMTDGFWNGSSPNVGNQDANTSNIYDGSPYADAYSNTLADVAMKYYKNDLAASLDNVVPTSSCDKASHQHMVTYGVSFGIKGTLNPADYDPCLLNGGKPPWPDPASGNLQKIDDLYHAAINGRGLFFSASNPQELVNSLISVTSNISSRMSSGASVSVNGEELNTQTVLYQASYSSDDWTGDVTAYPVDSTTGEIKKEAKDILWHASDQLQLIDPGDRNIVTYDPDLKKGIDFTYSSLDTNQKTMMNSDSNVVDYIRGKEITGFRTRTKRLADIVHSAPLLMGETIYVGGNDGMLHAFNAATGKERFAYIPNLVMDNYYNKSNPDQSFFKPGYQHKFFVDMTPVAKKNVDFDGDNTDDKFTLLVGGLGKGGKGYYCLDITNADSKNYNSPISDIQDMVKWEYPAATDNDMGYSYSMPVIVQSNIPTSEEPSKNKHKWVIIFGNGYGSANGHAVLYILDVNGTLIRKIDTGVAGCNGLSTPSVIDANNDLRADYAYAGDLKGNLWKFNLTDPDPDKWGVAYKNASSVPQPLFSVPGKPITSKPDVMLNCENNNINSALKCTNQYTHGYMVMFGTGKYLNEQDRLNTDPQYVFGLWDYGDDGDDSEYLGTFNKTGSPQLSNMDPTITLLEQTQVDYGYYDGSFLRTLSNNTPVWSTQCDSTSGQYPDPAPNSNVGWFFELPVPGERIIKDVFIRNNKLIYLTFTPDASPCSGGGTSMINEVNACTGGRLLSPQFDINGDNKITDADRIDIGLVDQSGNKIFVSPTGQSRPGLLYPPAFIRFPGKPVEMKIFSSSAATTETVFEVTEPRGLFYWRLY